jgi:peptidoglycan/LPS O-acetylase OafA/YrhL
VFFLPGIFRIVPIITVAWSLSFEFAFYLFVPFITLIVSREGENRRRRIALLGAMWVLFALSEAFLFHGTHIRMLSFVSGMLLQEITTNRNVATFVTGRGQWISICALVVTASYHFAVQSKHVVGPLGVLSVALMSAAIFWFVLHALEYPGALQKVCTWRPMRYWGNISYSYYLAHGITLKALATLLARLQLQSHPVLTYFMALAIGLVATWVSASVLYLLVEKPLSLAAPKKQRAHAGAAVLGPLPWWLRKGRTAAETAGNP